MEPPVRVNRKNRHLQVDPKLMDRCYTCGTCMGGCPATGTVEGWDAAQGHPGPGPGDGG